MKKSIVCLAPALLLGACGTTETVQMANPASEYCIELGGELKIEKGEEGERGVCHLPTGEVIDEWELFRRDHPAEP